MGQFKASAGKKEQQLWRTACMASLMPSVTILEESTLCAQGYLALLTNPQYLSKFKGGHVVFVRFLG